MDLQFLANVYILSEKPTYFEIQAADGLSQTGVTAVQFLSNLLAARYDDWRARRESQRAAGGSGGENGAGGESSSGSGASPKPASSSLARELWDEFFVPYLGLVPKFGLHGILAMVELFHLRKYNCGWAEYFFSLKQVPESFGVTSYFRGAYFSA